VLCGGFSLPLEGGGFSLPLAGGGFSLPLGVGFFFAGGWGGGSPAPHPTNSATDSAASRPARKRGRNAHMIDLLLVVHGPPRPSQESLRKGHADGRFAWKKPG